MARDFKKIKAWQYADDLTAMVYSKTKTFPREELYGITSQIRRAIVSVPANIAEGYERQSTPEYRRFLLIAKGSSGEIRAQVLLARNLGYLSQEEADRLIGSCVEITKMLGRLAWKLRSSK